MIPCSDGAGEVVEVGQKVTRWKRGDKVITLLSQAHLYGPSSPATLSSGLGGSLDGTLREYGAFNEHGLVRMPKNLSYAEASTLCCAGVTSWNALFGLRPLRPGQTVLVLGTGGVSLFALQVRCVLNTRSGSVLRYFQFAKAAGATVIATTSSVEKGERLRELGADHIIDYTKDPDWGTTVKRLSDNGEGADHVVEVGGAATLEQSMKAIKLEGIMSIVGAVGESGSAHVPTILDCWLNNFVARGIAVGSRAMIEEMVAAVEANDIHPVLDSKRFSLQEAKEAFVHFVSRESLSWEFYS